MTNMKTQLERPCEAARPQGIACRLCMVVLFLTCAQLGALGDTIILHDEVYVKGPKLLLSDIAEIQGVNASFLADLELAPAAAPGGLRRVNASFVLSRIRSQGFDEADFEVTGARQVTAKTLYLDITREMIADDLRQFIEMEMPWDPNDTIIDVVRPPQDYVVPDGNVEFRWRKNPQYGYLGTGAFRGEVLVDGEVERIFHARAMVQSYGDVVVAATDLRRGDPLTPRNLRMEKRELSTVDRGAFFRVEDVMGYLAKSTHFDGQVITSRKVMQPTLVKRSQIVVVQTIIGAMTIQSRAKAQQDGVAGDLIRCMNVGSKDEFIGRVRADGSVAVE